jgi:heme/copper-type cytochrome/quinol oxidase subunit 1
MIPPREVRMEFLNFLLILGAGYLVVRHPRRERLAFGLLVTSAVLMAAVFLLGTRTAVLPPFNY